MKPHFLKLCLVAIFSFALFSCSTDNDGIYFDESSEVITATKVEYSSIESKILELVNEHRVSIGLSALQPLDIVSNVAGGHTDYMIKVENINHDNFAKRSENLIKNAHAKTVGENVAYGYFTAENVLKGWLDSEGHRAVIENPKYTHFGISTKSNDKNRNYFTQIFINK
jgi:uncharacterized protein YkwD